MEMNWPNRLTIIRMILVPVFMALMLTGYMYFALAVYIIASLTDTLDGYLARKNKQVTVFGKFMDPLADKLLVMSALLVFCAWGQMPVWAVMLVLARELAVTSQRTVAAADGIILQAGWSGKIKMAATCVCICIMLVPTVANFALFAGVTMNTVCVFVIVATTLISCWDYFYSNRKVFKKSM